MRTMQIKRTKKGENEFSLTGLTLGQILAIRHAFEGYGDNISPVGYDVLCGLRNLNLETIHPFGDK